MSKDEELHLEKIIQSIQDGTLKSLNPIYDGYFDKKSYLQLWKTLIEQKKSLEVIQISRSNELDLYNLIFQYLFNNEVLKIFKLDGDSKVGFCFPTSIKENSSLEVLKLGNISLDGEKLKILNKFLLNCPNLQQLTLTRNSINKEKMKLIVEGIFSSKSLLKLKIDANTIEDCQEFYDALKKNDSIESLTLSGTSYSKECLCKSIKNNTRLKKLKLPWDLQLKEIKEYVPLFEMLEGLPNLTHFDMRLNDLEDNVGYKLLLKLMDKINLRVLNLAKNSLGDSTSKVLVNLLKKNQKLEILNLDGNLFDVIQVCKIMKSLNDHTSIQNLNLSNNHMSVNEFGKGNFDFQNQSLKILNLSGCYFRSSVFKNLMRELVNNRSIIELDFSNNNIEIDEEMIPYFSYNTFLQVLNLGFCQFKEEDFEHLCKGLKENKTLKELCIQKCKIGDNSCKHINHVFDGKSMMKIIDLSYNYITNIGIKYLDNLYMKCTSLNLSCNKITEECKEYIHNRIFFNYDLVECNIKNSGIRFCKELDWVIERNKNFIKNELKVQKMSFFDINFN